MTREELAEWCQRNDTEISSRNLGKAPSVSERDQLAEQTSGSIVRALREAGVDDKLKMSKREAVAVMQKGLTEYAKREAQRTAKAEYLRKRSIDNLPQVELQDRAVEEGGSTILLPGGR